MKKFAFAVSTLLFVLTACQKGADLVNPDNPTGGSTNGSKLVRIGTRTGADSIALDFSYNAANLINQMTYSGTINSTPVAIQIKISRNASNVITSTVTTSSFYAAIGVDSVIATYVYDAATSHYKYSVANYNYLGMHNSDSAVYAYDASGKVASGISYHNDGTGYVPDSKTDYTYNGNNVATEKSYTYNGASFDLDELDSYDQYDAKPNPLLFVKDAPVLGITTFFSANNPVKKTVTDYSSGSAVTSNGTATYTYNANNLPTYMTSSDGSTLSTSTYYYQ